MENGVKNLKGARLFAKASFLRIGVSEERINSG
jgi:hypothetical protein